MGKEKRRRLQNLKDKVKGTADEIKTQKELKLMEKEQEALYKTTLMIMEKENLTYQQVIECYEQDPEFSYCKKFQIGFFWMTADFLHMRKHRDEFLASLTSEEMEIHRREEEKGLWKEIRKQLKEKILEELRLKKRQGEKTISEEELDKILDGLNPEEEEVPEAANVPDLDSQEFETDEEFMACIEKLHKMQEEEAAANEQSEKESD